MDCVLAPRTAHLDRQTAAKPCDPVAKRFVRWADFPRTPCSHMGLVDRANSFGEDSRSTTPASRRRVLSDFDANGHAASSSAERSRTPRQACRGVVTESRNARSATVVSHSVDQVNASQRSTARRGRAREGCGARSRTPSIVGGLRCATAQTIEPTRSVGGATPGSAAPTGNAPSAGRQQPRRRSLAERRCKSPLPADREVVRVSATSQGVG